MTREGNLPGPCGAWAGPLPTRSPVTLLIALKEVTPTRPTAAEEGRLREAGRVAQGHTARKLCS